MFDRPSPTELKALLELDTAADRRSLFCSHYDDCLDHALSKKWQSWSCESCSLFAVRREMFVAFARTFEAARVECDASLH